MKSVSTEFGALWVLYNVNRIVCTVNHFKFSYNAISYKQYPEKKMLFS